MAVLILALFWLAAGSLWAAPATEPAKLTFTKVFPKSEPEYTFVSVTETGQAMVESRRLDEPTHPDSVTLSRETTARLFALVAEINHFRGHPDWEPKQRVAAMGKKTFVYEKGSERNEVTFNYATLPAVQRLVELFECLARTWYYHERLTRAIVYERLSLLELIRQVEWDFNNNRLAEPVLLEPILRQLVNDPRVLHLVQTKAQRLLERLGDNRATISFSRTVNSNPGLYLALRVREDGTTTYEMRSFEAVPQPGELVLPAAVVTRIFGLAEQLNYFRRPPETRVTNRPEADERTTFTYEQGAERQEISFTSTTLPPLRELTSIAERILRQQWHRRNLEASRGDPERIGTAVVLLEREIREGRLIDPSELAGLLNEIASDRQVPRSAQQEAAQLAARVRK